MLREVTPKEVMELAFKQRIWVLKRYDTPEHHGFDFIDLEVFGTIHEIKKAVESGSFLFMADDVSAPAERVKNVALRYQ